MANDDKKQNTLIDTDITTDHPKGRRAFIGAVGAAGVGAALVASGAKAQTIDSDNGTWTDDAGCGRGSGGYYTGISDVDDGSTGTDLGGQGRGAPYC